ncbi:MAG: hypothetical protein IJE05_06320 [Clostridia bacterium]|nr:hypothetical protein [Clostridia bacterium]
MSDKIVKEAIKVDFHIHSIGSKFKDHAKVKDLTIDNIDILIGKLNKYNINMCAITDHDNFEYEIYKRLKEEEGKGSIKKVLPGVEFSVAFENKVLHIIVVFDDSEEDKVKSIQKILFGDSDKPQYDDIEKNAYTEKKFLEIMKEINLSNIMIAHQKGTLSSTGKPKKNDVLSLGEEKLEELVFVDYFDSFEFKSSKNEIFNKHYLEKNKEKFKKNDIRFITGSDCHDWNNYPEDDEFKFTYLKCLPTFRGVSMAMTDYRRIKYINSFFTASNKLMEDIEIEINSINKKIELSKGINVIIGDNSIGKSLLIHKITGYSYLSNKTKMKKNYEEYLKANGIDIKTKIDKKMIYEFDKQGGIREKFEQKKLTGTDFLKKYFPVPPNIIFEKQLVLQEVSNFINYLKLKKEFKTYINNINSFKIYLRKEKSNSVTFNNVDIDLSMKLQKYKELLDNYNFILNKINLILQDTKLLDKEDITRINELKLEFEKLNTKYGNYKKTTEREIVKINVINDVIRETEDRIEKIKTDEDKKFEIYKNAKNKLVENICKILTTQKNIEKYEPKLEEKELDISTNIIGDYKFVAKCSVSKISNDYIIEKIRQPFKKKYKDLDIDKIDSDNLEDMLPDDPEESDDKIEYYRKLIEANINEDFEIKNTIINKDEEDKTKEMSSGFNSKIYFEILSYQDKDEGIYIIDQPEDDVSQTSIKKFLLEDFKEMSNHRQIIIITHNPQFIVNLDVDNVIFIEKKDGEIQINYGALEYKDDFIDMLNIISENIDGGIDTINERWKRYEKNI